MSRNIAFYSLLSRIVDEILFDREDAQLKQRVSMLIEKNGMLTGSTDGFRHLGLIYSRLEGAAKARGKYLPIHSSLVGEIDALVLDRKAIESDKGWIRQALFLVLQSCSTPQDVRDAVPNGLASLIPECASLPRTRPEAYTLADNPRSYKQYMDLREKIDFYVAARLLY